MVLTNRKSHPFQKVLAKNLQILQTQSLIKIWSLAIDWQPQEEQISNIKVELQVLKQISQVLLANLLLRGVCRENYK